MKIKVLIVEDKRIVAEDISDRLKKHGMDVVGICSSGATAIETAKKINPDLVLMDIHLDGPMDGITAALSILDHRRVPIIYLTDFTDEQTVERAKATRPANYISKPFKETDLIRAIDLAFSNAREDELNDQNHNLHLPDMIFVRTDSQQYVKIALQDILFLEADRAYCKIVTGTTTYVLSTSMNHIHDQIGNPYFIRVHRSYIINVNRVEELHGNALRLGGKEVNVGGEYRENLMKYMKIVK